MSGREAPAEGAARKPPSRFQAGWARWVAAFAEHVYASTKVVGREHVPRSGPAILAGNHTGLVDGPVVLGASPRGVHFIMKPSLGRGLGGLILRAAGQVALADAGGHEALRTCLALLERGQVVGIFPEGTRGDGRMLRIHPGVAWLAVNSGAPVIPFACLGTRHQGEGASHFPPPRRRIHVSFGPALRLELDPAAARRQRIAAAIEQIGPGLAAHVAAAVAASGVALPRDTGRETK
ncbi:MAG: 1-acyl-sn-glycerol-3-phosphate acyltransferase [Bifidobacteriaceae bacterium]|jgi:1-acyl-sn-glycerol-3-phosphate acyltransferase|nr:1-acyl-sn-glycerol-3-phosphate acyltransferase [Bifidobacteriaceae bacterium]